MNVIITKLFSLFSNIFCQRIRIILNDFSSPSDDDGGGWHRRFRYLLRQVVAADSHSGMRLLPDGGHREFRAHQRGGRYLPHARIRRRDKYDGMPGKSRRGREQSAVRHAAGYQLRDPDILTRRCHLM